MLFVIIKTSCKLGDAFYEGQTNMNYIIFAETSYCEEKPMRFEKKQSHNNQTSNICIHILQKKSCNVFYSFWVFVFDLNRTNHNDTSQCNADQLIIVRFGVSHPPE